MTSNFQNESSQKRSLVVEKKKKNTFYDSDVFSDRELPYFVATIITNITITVYCTREGGWKINEGKRRETGCYRWKLTYGSYLLVGWWSFSPLKELKAPGDFSTWKSATRALLLASFLWFAFRGQGINRERCRSRSENLFDTDIHR